MQKRNLIKGYLFVVASGIIFGCMPLGAKFIYAEGVTSLSLVFLRNLLATPVLALLAVLQRQKLKTDMRSVGKVSLIALAGCALTPTLLFSSYLFMASGPATVFHFIYPAAVTLGSLVFLRQKVQKANIYCMLLCTAGLLLFFEPGSQIAPLGAALALFSGVTYAIYILLLSVFPQKTLSGFALNFYITALSALFLLPVCLITKQLSFPASTVGWLVLVIFSLAINIGALVLFQTGTFYIGGQRAAILSTTEPVTGLVIGILVFHEGFSVLSIVGSVLVLASSVLIAIFDSKKNSAGN